MDIHVDSKLFKEASAKLIIGHRYGLIGPNGSGKTTLLKHIKESHTSNATTMYMVNQEQEVDDSVLDSSLIDVMLDSHIRRKQLLAQLNDDEDITLDRLQDIDDELKAMDAYRAEAKARKILNGLGFSHAQHTEKVSSFSGGWRKRIVLGCAIFMEPDILMLDEPTNHLDLNAVIWLGSWLTTQKTVVVVSHDVSFLNTVCTDIIHIENKKLVQYRGNYDVFLTTKAQDKKRHHASSNIKEYRPLFKWEPLSFGTMVATTAIQLEDVSYAYDSNPDRYILTDVNFSLWTDSRIALVGPNGSGKTTLMKLLSGELSPTSGTYTVSRHIKIGRYSQHFVDQLPLDLTPIDYVMSVANINATMMTPFNTRAKLGIFGLEGSTHQRPINTLSGGQKVRVAFAGLSAMIPHMLLLDEPTNHLDIESIDALATSINKFQGGVLISTHDARLIDAINADIWMIEDGYVHQFQVHKNYKPTMDDYKDYVLSME